MSSIYEPRIGEPWRDERLPLLGGDAMSRTLVWRNEKPVTAATFLGEAQALAERLPDAPAAVNLCEDRYAFLLLFCALLLRGQTNLLPSSRAPAAVAEVMAAHPGSCALGETDPAAPIAGFVRIDLPSGATPLNHVPRIPADLVALVGYTSGSTGKPHPNLKSWRSLHCSNAGNLDLLHSLAGDLFHVIATVPSQHMYGIEMATLLPLLGNVAISTARPFFPADIATALATVPTPRVLVTTPLHLRKLLDADIDLPPVAMIVSATAPMPPDLAAAAEIRFSTRVEEVFGSTETCVIAHRRTAHDETWAPYRGVHLHPQPDGVQVIAPQLNAPVTLADIVRLEDGGQRFRLCGRNADLLEIAGKRASLADLTHRLLSIDGVQDGVVLQLDEPASGVRRIAALVVAPTRDEAGILADLRRVIDPAFLPRPIKRVAALPRNETGKLPRAELLKFF